jgi:hypothetical protein
VFSSFSFSLLVKAAKDTGRLDELFSAKNRNLRTPIQTAAALGRKVTAGWLCTQSVLNRTMLEAVKWGEDTEEGEMKMPWLVLRKGYRPEYVL